MSSAVPNTVVVLMKDSSVLSSRSSLLPFTALLVLLARRPQPPRALVWAVIAYNALWSIDSLWLLASGWVAPGALGVAFVIAQALAVALLAAWQYVTLRREPAMPA